VIRSTLRFPVLALSIAVAAALVSGCGTKATEPRVGQETANQVAIQLGASAASSTGGVGAEFTAIVQSLPGSGGPLKGPSLEAVNVAADTVWVVGGMTFETSRSWYDDTHQPVASWGPTVVGMLWNSRATGTVSGQQFYGQASRTTQFDIFGVATDQDTAVVNGGVQDTCQSAFTSTDTQRVTYLFAASNITMGAVRLDKTGANPYPLAGTMTWVLGVDKLRSSNRGDVEAHFDATAVVTFNGTANPQVVINGQYHYTLNLVTGAVTPIAS
jgi:hypothetical protein